MRDGEGGRVESLTVVLYRHQGLIALHSEAHLHPAGMGVFPDVGQRFLDDAQQLHLHHRLQYSLCQIVRDDPLRLDLVALLEPPQVLIQSGQETSLGREGRLHTQDVLADIGVGVLGDDGQAGQVCLGLPGLAAGEQFAGGLSLHVHVAQHLAQAIVQLPRQPLPLLQHRQRPLLLEQLDPRPFTGKGPAVSR